MKANTTPTHSGLTRRGFEAGFVLAALAALWPFTTQSSEARPTPAQSPQAASVEESSWQELAEMPVPAVGVGDRRG